MQMLDEFVVHAIEKYSLAHGIGPGVYRQAGLPNILRQNNDSPPYHCVAHAILRVR